MLQTEVAQRDYVKTYEEIYAGRKLGNYRIGDDVPIRVSGEGKGERKPDTDFATNACRQAIASFPQIKVVDHTGAYYGARYSCFPNDIDYRWSAALMVWKPEGSDDILAAPSPWGSWLLQMPSCWD